MRVVLQRCKRGSVTIAGRTVGAIEHGYVLLVAFTEGDTLEQVQWMARKIHALRVFSDAEGALNLSIDQVLGSVLVVSQFTLYGDAQKGNRPSFIRSAPGVVARPLYEAFLVALREFLGEGRVACGEFGADMQVELVNDGPVTLILDR